jgi:DNA-directed RNA polymerase subunit RPC12/RpoP
LPQIKYKCFNCSADFSVKYILVKPGEVKCPQCGSANVQENKNTGCGCGSGSRFT